MIVISREIHHLSIYNYIINSLHGSTPISTFLKCINNHPHNNNEISAWPRLLIHNSQHACTRARAHTHRRNYSGENHSHRVLRVNSITDHPVDDPSRSFWFTYSKYTTNGKSRNSKSFYPYIKLYFYSIVNITYIL